RLLALELLVEVDFLGEHALVTAGRLGHGVLQADVAVGGGLGRLLADGHLDVGRVGADDLDVAVAVHGHEPDAAVGSGLAGLGGRLLVGPGRAGRGRGRSAGRFLALGGAGRLGNDLDVAVAAGGRREARLAVADEADVAGAVR